MNKGKVVIILFGTCGCGKTSVGKMLSTEEGWLFYDADDFHSENNKLKMSRGIALTDADREPWLRSMNKELQNSKVTCLLGCSALKKKYRTMLVDGLGKDEYVFVFLDVSKEEVKKRLKERKGHFFNADLVNSQFDCLERPEGEEKRTVVTIDCNGVELGETCKKVHRSIVDHFDKKKREIV